MKQQSLLFVTIITEEPEVMAYTFSRCAYLVFGEFDNARRLRIQRRLRREIDDDKRGDVGYYNALVEHILRTDGFLFRSLEDSDAIPVCDGLFPVYAML